MNRLKNILQITSMVLVMSVFFGSCKEFEAPELAVPTSVAIPKENITSSGFKITWDKVTGADHYHLDVATDDKFTSKDKGSFKDRKIDNVDTYTLETGLSPNTEYHVRIRAGTGSFRSEYSAVKKFTTKMEAPVIALKGGVLPTSLTVEWSPIEGADKYFIDVSTDENFGTSKFVSGFKDKDLGKVLEKEITGLVPGITYYVRVRAAKGTGRSVNSNKLNQMTTALAAPVIALKGGVLPTSLTVEWSPIEGADKYFIDVSTDENFAGENFVTGFKDKDLGNVTEKRITGLETDTPYYVRVRAAKGTGRSVNSNKLSATTTH